MRILHVFDHSLPLQSGYAIGNARMLNEQNALGIETIQLTGTAHIAPYQENETVDGLEYFRTKSNIPLIDKIPLLDHWDQYRTLKKRIEKIVRLENPDIIHAHSSALNGLAALKVGNKYNIPVHYELSFPWEDKAFSQGACDQGGLRYEINRRLETKTLKSAASISTLGEGLKKEIVARGIEPEKVTVIPQAAHVSPLAAQSASCQELKEKLNIKDMTVLGYIGSFYDYEGVDIFLRSMRSVMMRVPNACIVLVGTGPEEDALKMLADRLLLGDRVMFTGKVPHKKLQDYYNLVDIMVCPRKKTKYTELVTSIKPLEAMARGKLVIASDVAGHSELIKDGKIGVLFRAGDPISLSQKIGEIIEKQDHWLKIKEAAYQFVEKERNWKDSMALYQNIYESMIKK